MSSSAQSFRRDVPWSDSEKKAARKAFNLAYKKQCAAVTAKVKKMMASGSDPSNVWRVHDYLSVQRRAVDALFDYRYSVLLRVFAKLIYAGLLTEADLSGLREDKLEEIKSWMRL